MIVVPFLPLIPMMGTPPAQVSPQEKVPSAFGRDRDVCTRPDDPCRLGAPISFDRPLTEAPNMTQTPLKIGVAVGLHEVTFGGTGQLVWREGGIRRLEGETVSARREGATVILRQGVREIGRFEGGVGFRPDAETLVRINEKSYRGQVEVVPDPKEPDKVNAVNAVLLEDYLKGVLPAEVIPTWGMEALKAQAIAARTYSIANLGRRKERGFDLYANTDDQMYSGVTAEHAATSQAVGATRGQVMSYDGKPINALFFAASGGMTDSAEAVWGVKLPYIQPRPDFDQQAPKYRWTKQVSQAELQKALAKFNWDLGPIRHIEVLEKTPGGRASLVRLIGEKGEAQFDAKALRFSVGLFSTRFSAKPDGDGFLFEGGGWGHGLGLSQWGARQMAIDGKLAPDILRHYYQGIQIESLPGTLNSSADDHQGIPTGSPAQGVPGMVVKSSKTAALVASCRSNETAKAEPASL